MLGNFTYCNPTKLHFGKDSLNMLKGELEKFGKNVMLSYGGGSIKKNGIYDKVVAILKACGKNIFEDGGVMPNPTVEKLYEGCKIVRENNIDLILAVGGGSTCDYAKAVSVSAYCEEDPYRTRRLRIDDGRNGQRNERRSGYYQSRGKAENRTRIRGGSISEICRSQSRIYLYRSRISDEIGNLRYHVPHSRTIFFG